MGAVTGLTGLAEAERTASRIGADRNDFDTEFGPTNVQLHRVAVAVDLGDAGEALDVAKGIDTREPLSRAPGPPHDRRRPSPRPTPSHGRGHHNLLDAERLAAEHVRSHHLAKTTIGDLLEQSGRRPPTDLQDSRSDAGQRADQAPPSQLMSMASVQQHGRISATPRSTPT
jgi:hypothetical protein